MIKTFFADNATLMSPRTAKYVEAMIREGDNFDYFKWLQKVRQEEAQAKLTTATGISGDLAAAEMEKSPSTLVGQHTQPNPALRLVSRTIRAAPRGQRHLRQAKSQTTKDRLRRWLKKVRRAWREFQASRARDAIYEYLAAVFAIVMHYKVRRRTNRLLRRTFEFADLTFDRNADPFTAVIRCTSGRDIDGKTISKWARALRYAGRQKEPETRLKTFMKNIGGVNACADRYATLMRHS
jgi:3-methyladenine DNA glycosylase Tag